MAAMDVEKTIEFLLEHQATFAVQLQQLTESQRQLAESQRQTDAQSRVQQQQIGSLVSIVTDLAEEQRRFEQKTDERFREVAKKFEEVGEKFEEVGEKINVLVRVVDDVVRRSGRNKQ